MMNALSRAGLHRILPVLTCIAIMGGCVAVYGSQSTPVALPEADPGLLAGNLQTKDIVAGYLPMKALPNSLALLPPSPVAGSLEFALDEDVARRSFALRGTPRFTLALSDYDLSFRTQPAHSPAH